MSGLFPREGTSRTPGASSSETVLKVVESMLVPEVLQGRFVWRSGLKHKADLEVSVDVVGIVVPLVVVSGWIVEVGRGREMNGW